MPVFSRRVFGAPAAPFRSGWLLDRLGLRTSFAGGALRTVKFVEQPLVQAKCLFPAVEFVARLLRLFLVRAKIQLNITVRHGSSLRRDGRQVKIRRKAHSSLAKGRKCDCHRTNSCMQGPFGVS